MAAPKGNKFAKGNNGGNPGYGQINFVKEKVKKFCPLWWKEWEAMMSGEAFSDELKKFLAKDKNNQKKTLEGFQKIFKDATDCKKFAMQEFNKLQVKMMPTVLAGDDDNPLILQFDEPFKLTSKTSGDNKKPEEV